MPVAVEDLYSEEPSAATGTAALAGTTDAQAAQAQAPETVVSQDAEASYAGTKDAAAASGSASTGQASLSAARDAEDSGYNAQTGVIDPTQTASAALNRITSQDSPTMRRAATQGMLTAGKRGLENSSFAAGAAQGAMVDRATPLAQQESQQSFQQDLTNQASINRAREFSATMKTNVSLANASESNKLAALNATLGTDISKFNAQQLNQMEALNTQLGTEVSLANAKAYNEASALNAQLETAVAQGNQQEANRINTRMAELQTEIELNNASMRTQVSLENASAANRAALTNATLETEVSLSNARSQDAMRRDVLAQNAALNEQFMRGEQALDLASVQGRYQQLISSNETAARLYDSYFQSIGAAMSNDKITPERVAAYVNVQQSMLEAGLRMMDGMNNLDLGDFELPGAVSGTPGAIAPVPGTDTGGGTQPSTPQPGDPGYWTQERLDDLLGKFKL